MTKYFQLLRIKHYIKNVLIFLPMICAKQVSFENFSKTIVGFVAFSFMTSFIYIINDIKDIEKDRLHPRKSARPLPAGEITISTAIKISILLFVISLSLNTVIGITILNEEFVFLIAYMIINILYSFGLKNIAIVDVLLLTFGFVFRVYYGATIVEVDVSSWLFLTVLNAALFLALGKRKKELINSVDTRKVLEEYSEAFLDKFQYLSLGLTLVFYSLWVTEQNVELLFLTIPLLMTIFMKYSLIIEKSVEGDPTTIIYEDRLLMLLCLLYGILMMYLLIGL